MARATLVTKMKTLTAVILAAGESKRMRSGRPKAVHALGGRPLIDYPVRIARALGARLVLVVGRGGDEVRAAVGEAPDLAYVEQKDRLGTAHALLQARGACGDGAGAILVLPGDQPLMSEATLRALVEHHRVTAAAATLLTAEAADSTGYGRVVREGGRPAAIVEHRDATPEQRAIREIGTSTYCFDAKRLWPALDRVTPHNEQGEFYLTDVVAILWRDGAPVEALRAPDPEECMGINDRKQLAAAAAALRRRTLERLMADGVTVLDPAATYVDDTVAVGADTVIYPGAVLEGATVIGTECVVGSGCHVSGSRIGDRVTLKPYCVLSGAVVEDEAQIGPFCHLRPLSHVGARAKIGNFVEVKKSRIGRGSKASHLAYIGDATIGEGVNIGAGVILVNYDGAAKHATTIGDGAFVGSNSSLVAPITIGADAFVAAGSVVTKDVPPGALAVERSQQVMKEGWTARKKARRAAAKPKGH
jgi:bifunctional UDP-N-acetylglucosamine pyrophosphorylase/glucosamine-1-phosphate N-acetyltransferase